MSVPALDQIRTVYSFTAPLLNWIVVIVAFIFIGAILLARRRARTAVAVGIVVAASAILISSNRHREGPQGPPKSSLWQSTPS
jgi:hypothetical protein